MNNMVIFYGFASATIVSFLLLVASLTIKKGLPAYIAIPLSIPCSMYVAASFYVPAFFPFLILVGAYHMNRNKTMKAALCFAPYMLLSGTIIIFGYILNAW